MAGGGGESKTSNAPWKGQIPFLTGGAISPAISEPVPINADWLRWATQTAQTGMPMGSPPPMDMRNPLLSGENVYAGEPNIFGQSYSPQMQGPQTTAQLLAVLQGMREPTVGPPLGPNAPAPGETTLPGGGTSSPFPTYPRPGVAPGGDGATAAPPSNAARTLAEVLANGPGVKMQSMPASAFAGNYGDWEQGNARHWASKMREG